MECHGENSVSSGWALRAGTKFEQKRKKEVAFQNNKKQETRRFLAARYEMERKQSAPISGCHDLRGLQGAEKKQKWASCAHLICFLRMVNCLTVF